MFDKILTILISALLATFLIEVSIPGEKHKAKIERIFKDSGMSVNQGMTRTYEQYVAMFDGHEVILTFGDVDEFKEGDSVGYALTPIAGNMKSMTNLRSRYKTTVHSYAMLIVLALVCVVGQVLNVAVKWSKRNKEIIQILLFSMIVVAAYILIFK